MPKFLRVLVASVTVVEQGLSAKCNKAKIYIFKKEFLHPRAS